MLVVCSLGAVAKAAEAWHQQCDSGVGGMLAGSSGKGSRGMASAHSRCKGPILGSMHDPALSTVYEALC